MKKKIDNYWLYFHHNNLDSIFAALERAELPEEFSIKMFMLITSNNLFQELKTWTPSNYKAEYLEEGESLVTIKLTKFLDKEEENKISGHLNLVRIGDSNVYTAISFDSLLFVKAVMLKFFSHYYSNISRLYISSNQIKLILDGLKQNTSGDIITDRVVSYSRINNKQVISRSEEGKILYQNTLGFKRRTKESDLRWTDEDYAKSFQRAAENDQWIDKITFSVRKEGHELFFGSLSRDGVFKCNKNLRLFFNTILNAVSKIGSEKIKLFKQRSRIENHGQIKPLAIEFSSNVFKDVEQNHRLIKVISEFPKSSYTVYHGNPYLHASLVDYCDGSAYDVWVLSESRIILVPQLKASFSSISRLCEHIFRRFREGEIRELVVD